MLLNQGFARPTRNEGYLKRVCAPQKNALNSMPYIAMDAMQRMAGQSGPKLRRHRQKGIGAATRAAELHHAVVDACSQAVWAPQLLMFLCHCKLTCSETVCGCASVICTSTRMHTFVLWAYREPMQRIS